MPHDEVVQVREEAESFFRGEVEVTEINALELAREIQEGDLTRVSIRYTEQWESTFGLSRRVAARTRLGFTRKDYSPADSASSFGVKAIALSSILLGVPNCCIQLTGSHRVRCKYFSLSDILPRTP